MKSQHVDRAKSAEFQDVKLDYPEETTSSRQRRTTPLGEFRVNTYTTNDQQYPSVATLTDGGFVVTWDSGLPWGDSDTQDGSNFGVYAQRYDESGVAQGAEFRVNTYTTAYQEYPAIAGLTGGGFVVTWYGEGTTDFFGVYGQRYDASGVAQGAEFRVNTYTTSYQWFPAIAGLTDGGFVVTWDSNGQDADSSDIYGQRYDGSGVAQGAEFWVDTYTTSYQAGSAIAALTGGGFVVVWHSDAQDGSEYGIYAQRYAASGVAQGSEFRVNTYTTGYQWLSAIAGLTDGGFVVVWHSDPQDGSSDGIYGQRYDGIGVAQGAEFRVNTYTRNTQWFPAIAGLTGGGFVVTWESDQDGSIYGIYAQRYDGSGVAQGAEFQVNTYTTSLQGYPAIAGLTGGGFVVTWVSYGQDGSEYGVYAQTYIVPTINNNQLWLNEGQTVVLTTVMLSAQDPDTADTDLTFTVSNVQQGRFEFISNPGVPITSFTQQQVMDGTVQFVHDGTEVAPSYSVIVTDGFSTSSSAAATISFNPPQITCSIDTVSYTENTAATIIDAGILISDVNSANLTDATISITGGFVSSEDLLTFTNQNGITGSYASGTGVLTLTGTASVTDYQAALRSIQYQNSSDDPNTSVRTVSFVASDGVSESLAATRDVSVTTVNDAPVFVEGYDYRLSSLEAGATSIAGDTVGSIITDGSISDPDGVAVEAIAIRAVDDANGIWQYSLEGTTWTDIAPVSDTDSLLLDSDHKIRFVPKADFAGESSFTFRAWDKSSGIAGNTVSTSNHGGITAFSDTTAKGSIDVSDVSSDSAAAIRAISISAGGAVVGGLIGVAFWKFKQRSDWNIKWEKYPLANRIRKGLNLDIPNPNSDEGQEFLRVVERLEKDLGSRGIDLSGMMGAELNDLASQVVQAVRDNVHVDHVGFWKCGSNKVSAIGLRESAEIIVKEVVALRAGTVYETRKSREMEMVVTSPTVDA